MKFCCIINSIIFEISSAMIIETWALSVVTASSRFLHCICMLHAVSTLQMVNITNTSAFLTADSLFNFQGFYISAKICFHIIRGLLNQNESCMLCRLVNKGTQWTQWKPLKENNRSTEKNKPHPIWTQT